MKQTITITYLNHAKILEMHETRSMTQHIRETCGLSYSKNLSTILYEDNIACIAQIKEY